MVLGLTLCVCVSAEHSLRGECNALYPVLSTCYVRRSKEIMFLTLQSFCRGGRGPRSNRLDFGGDPNHDLDPRMFKKFFF